MTIPRPDSDVETTDEVLSALASVLAVLDDMGSSVDLARTRAQALRASRARGESYADSVTAADGPLVIDVVSDLLERLSIAGSRLRRAEVRALYVEGLTM